MRETLDWPSEYKALTKNHFSMNDYEIRPIAFEDRHLIQKWRNEQIFHLRQSAELTEEQQFSYFNTTIRSLFSEEQPKQILFGFYHQSILVGYGGLVHINYIDQHAEISFLMNTALQELNFETFWEAFLKLIIKPAFRELQLRKVFTYAFDVRPRLYNALEISGFMLEARLKEHCLVQGEYKDVLIHSFWNPHLGLTFREANASDCDLIYQWANDPVARQFALNSKTIAYDEHCQWFEGKLNSQHSHIFVFENLNRGVGLVRLDLDLERLEWVISYSVAPAFRGLGLGQVLINEIIHQYPNYSFKAVVRDENFASKQVFENLGFTHEWDHTLVPGQPCHVYRKPNQVQ